MPVQKCILSLYDLKVKDFTSLLDEDNSKEIDLELSGDLLEQHQGFWQELKKDDRKLSVLYGLLPDNISRNWPPVDISIGAGLVEHASSLIEICREHGITHCTIDLGMNSISQDNLYDEIQHRTSIIRGLLPAARKAGVKILIPLRFPLPYPTACEWLNALRLIDEVYDDQLEILLNIFPSEISPKDFPATFQKDFFFKVAGVRLRFAATSSSAWQALKLADWGRLFSQNDFDGFVTLAPELREESTLPQQLENFRNARALFTEEN